MDGVHDLVVLDRQLPDGDGIQLIEDLRLLPVTPPVIVLTAQGALVDRVNGLNLGADDYLIKPFELSELLARLRALIRRAHGQSASIIAIADVVIDTASHTVRKNGRLVPLTPREYALCA